MTDNQIWLTADAKKKLEDELAELKSVVMPEIAKRIEAAREEGDLKENGGYHAAKEEQGKTDARIRELTETLKRVVVGEAADDGIVKPGMLVTATILGDEETFLLGSREMAGDHDVDVFSPDSPLGRAINGLSVGASTSYLAPNGRSIEVVVVAAKPF